MTDTDGKSHAKGPNPNVCGCRAAGEKVWFGMARKLRLQYAGAFYHLINRGNYRADVFASDGGEGGVSKVPGRGVRETGMDGTRLRGHAE